VFLRNLSELLPDYTASHPRLYYFSIVTNLNLLRAEIKSRLYSGNFCYHSVQNLLSSRLLSNNFRLKIYKTVVLPVVCMGANLVSDVKEGT
jgi:hypothetical protein